jgi:hypothetical protein
MIAAQQAMMAQQRLQQQQPDPQGHPIEPGSALHQARSTSTSTGG